jgi:non-ribosomal peptide synthetase component F
LPLQYADYAVWQRRWLQGDVLERELHYWRSQLHGLQRLELPTDKARSGKNTGRGEVVCFEIEQELAERLRQLCQREGVTLFMLLVAGLQLVLSRYAGQTDVAIGTAIANRNRVEIEPLVGFFVNQLVLRTQLDRWLTVREFLAQVRETVLGAYAHQDLPFERLVEEITTERDPSRSPLFDHAIVLQALTEDQQWQVGDTELSSMSLDLAVAKLDLDILMFERDSITGFAYYNADLFSSPTIDHLMQGLRSTLDQFTRNVDAELNSISTAHNSSEFYAAQLATSFELLAV